jgi:tetratricopeptide (TPR) repeat protein
MIKYLLCVLLLYTGLMTIRGQDDPLLKSGNDKLTKRNFEGAIQDFNRLIVKDPGNVEALCGRAEAKIAQSNYAEAMKDAEQAMNIDDKNPKIYVITGDIFFYQKEYLKALKAYMDASQLPNAPPQAITGKAKVMNQLGDSKEAFRILDEAILKQPANAEFYYARGLLNNTKEKYVKSLQDFDKAFALNPNLNSFGLYLNRGVAYFNLEELEKALGDLNKAIEIDPKNASAYHSRGLIYYEQADYENAVKDFLKSSDYSPNNPVTYYNLGMAYNKMEDVENACLYFHKSCQLGNTNSCKMIIMVCSE